MPSILDQVRAEQKELTEAREAAAALNALAREHWDDPEFRREMAAVMTETIYQGWEYQSLLDLVSEVKHLGEDDRDTVREVRGLEAFITAKGGYIKASSITARSIDVPRLEMGFRVGEYEDKLKSNFSENQSNITDLGRKRLDAATYQYLLRLLQAAVASGGDQYISSAGVDKATFDTALREVQEKDEGSGVAVIGRIGMIGQVIDAVEESNSFTPETNEEIIKTGLLGRYKGANLVVVRNYLDGNDMPFFPGNEMWITARGATRFAFYGGLKSKEATDLNWYWEYVAKQSFGGVVHRPNRIRRYVDTSRTAYVREEP